MIAKARFRPSEGPALLQDRQGTTQPENCAGLVPEGRALN